MTNGDEPINPNAASNVRTKKLVEFGLTKRELMATEILAGLMANPERYRYVAEKVRSERWSHEDATRHNAEKALYLADALIEALNK